MRRIFLPALVLLGTLVALLWAGGFGWGPIVITKATEYKLVLFQGDPLNTITEAGWSLRVPFFTEVRSFDRRLQYLNAEPVEMLIKDSQRLIIDYYAIWQITDPLEFTRSYKDGRVGAEGRIQESVNALVGAKIGGLDLSQLLSRAAVLDQLDEESNAALGSTGVRVVDVRLNRTEIPKAAEPAAFNQMREQRRALSREYRAKGNTSAREIVADAERKARQVIAAARSESEVTRGEGDGEAAAIYAESYGADPEFYAFFRSLEAYRKALSTRTTLVLGSDHAFLRYLDPGIRE